MLKKYGKYAILGVLLLTFVVLLTACGKEEENQTNNGEKKGTDNRNDVITERFILENKDEDDIETSYEYVITYANDETKKIEQILIVRPATSQSKEIFSEHMDDLREMIEELEEELGASSGISITIDDQSDFDANTRLEDIYYKIALAMDLERIDENDETAQAYVFLYTGSTKKLIEMLESEGYVRK